MKFGTQVALMVLGLTMLTAILLQGWFINNLEERVAAQRAERYGMDSPTLRDGQPHEVNQILCSMGDGYRPCRLIDRTDERGTHLLAIPTGEWPLPTELLVCADLQRGTLSWCHTANAGGPAVEKENLFRTRLGMLDCASSNYCGAWRYEKWVQFRASSIPHLRSKRQYDLDVKNGRVITPSPILVNVYDPVFLGYTLNRAQK